MEQFLAFNVLLHVATGSTALLAGGIALASRKGGSTHRWSGWLFYAAMFFILASAVVSELYYERRFLLIVGLFSFYLNFTGMQSLKRIKARRIDWALAIFNAAVGLLFLAELLLKGQNGILFWAAGLALTWFSLEDIYQYSRQYQGGLPKHIGRMMGAYISTVTASIVTNVETEPAWIIWFAPTLVLTPLMIYFLRRYTTH